MKSYVLIEHAHGQLNPASAAAITIARQLGTEIHAIILGRGCVAITDQVAFLEGVHTVWIGNDPIYEYPLVERWAEAIVSIIPKNTACYCIAAATSLGKNLWPRMAGMLGVPHISEVTEIVDAYTFKRYIDAGRAIATVCITPKMQPICLTISATAFALASADNKNRKIENAPAVIRPIAYKSSNVTSTWCESNSHFPNNPLDCFDLAKADRVIAGGRGLGNAANCERLLKIAKRLGAAVAASGGAVHAGLAPNDCRVGQTGLTVAPRVYFALGISGTMHHIVGMVESKIIVAINSDPHAPIFHIADYGLVADLDTVFPEWENALDNMGY